MTFQQKIFALIIGAGLSLVIIELVRRRRLAEEYSFLWLLTGFGIIVLILWYDLLEWLTHLVGARTPEELEHLYAKLKLPLHLAESDYRQNQSLLQSCHDLGQRLAQDETRL